MTLATKHYYVYSFLDPRPKDEVNGVNIGGVGKGAVVGYVFGIAAAIIIIFSLVKAIEWGRKWVTEQKMEKEGKFFGGRGMRVGEVELETVRVWEK